MAEYRARDVRSEVPRDLDHQIPLQDSAGAGGRACARTDPTSVPSTRGGDHPRGGIARPHPHAVISTAASGTGEAGAVYQREVVAKATREFPELRKRYWGQHLWARGYFCATVGAVDEQTIKAYIENQKWDEDDQGFKITAPTEP